MHVRLHRLIGGEPCGSYWTMLALITLNLFLFLTGCVEAADEPLPSSSAPADFWAHWGDGSAELNGYQITQPRYGEKRTGEAIFVFVTETFTQRQRVKSNGGHGDEYPVIKLNDIRDFQTGVYDYNTMTSAFVRLDGQQSIGVPTKISFSMQEWCGHVWDQWLMQNNTWSRTGHSYFDGEADIETTGPIENNTLFADALPIYVRNLAGEWVKPGQTRTMSVIPSALQTRMRHRPPTPKTIQVHRSPTTQSIQVPAGEFDAEIWTLKHNDALYATFAVEKAAPHRLLQWTGPDGGTGSLTGTTRLRYWQKAREGDEALRSALGLAPRK